ncbi:MAG TPA: hypothetical protein VF638_03030 [Sphingomonas sp.]|jgi:hypothetical protein
MTPPLKIAEQPTQEGVTRAREDAIATALCLLDTFAGEELTHVYGNGQEICSTDVCIALANAFGVELEAGWYREVAALCATPKPADPTSDERTAYAALHTVQHEGANIVQPVAGGNIVAWAASEIRALRERIAADPTSEAQIFYDAVKRYSYPAGVQVVTRVHATGWDVYDPAKWPADPTSGAVERMREADAHVSPHETAEDILFRLTLAISRDEIACAKYTDELSLAAEFFQWSAEHAEQSISSSREARAREIFDAFGITYNLGALEEMVGFLAWEAGLATQSLTLNTTLNCVTASDVMQPHLTQDEAQDLADQCNREQGL